MKLFLTGGTGFIGQPLTQKLIGQGREVTVLVRKPASPQAQALTQMGAHCVQGDVTERESMRAAMTGATAVVHNAAFYEYGVDAVGRKRMNTINVQGTDNVLSLALELKIPRVLYISSTVAFGHTGGLVRDETYQRQAPYYTWYEQTKAEAHAHALQYVQRGLPLIIASPNSVVGVNDHSPWGYFLRLYLNHIKPPIGWAAQNPFGIVEVSDLVAGLALALEKGRIGENYFFSGEPLAFHEHVGFWERKPGAMKTLFWLPTQVAGWLFWPMEPLLRALGLPAFISRETARAAGIPMNYSSEKAKQKLGWTHKAAEQMWEQIIEAELAIQKQRAHQNLLTRLKPLDR